jgi:hypothetical protein
MRMRFHGSPQGLLAHDRQRICVIDKNPAIDSLFIRRMANEFGETFPDSMDSTVFVG